MRSVLHKQILANTLLPAARNALLLGSCGKRTVAPKVLQYILHLLQVPLRDPADGRTVIDWGGLVESLLKEVLACKVDASSKPYLLALCKVAAALIGQVDEASDASIRRCRMLCQQTIGATKDRMLLKEIAVVMERLQSLDITSSQPLDDNEVAQLQEAIVQHAACGDLAGYPLPFAIDATPSRSAAQSTRRAYRASAATNDSSSDDEVEDEDAVSKPPTAATRDRPIRAARSAQKPIIESDSSSDSEESEFEEGTQFAEAVEELSLVTQQSNAAAEQCVATSTVRLSVPEDSDSDSDFENPPPKVVKKAVKNTARVPTRGMLTDNVVV